MAAGLLGMLALGAGRATSAATAPPPPQSAAEAAFNRAWHEVALGAKKAERAGDWVLEKTEDGAISLYRSALNPSAVNIGAAADREVDDAAILSKVKTRLLADPSTSSRAINVEVDRGVVTMTGQVQSDEEAKTALRLAQQTAGVTRVVSRLRWPGMGVMRASH